MTVSASRPGLIPLPFLLAGFFFTAQQLKAGGPEAAPALTDITVRTVLSSGVQVPLAPPTAVTEVAVSGKEGGGGIKVYFIDVGQGDAEYIELPDGRNVLVDGGPAVRNGGPADTSHPPTDPPLAHFLLQKGVKKLDHVVLTHPHADHYVGLKYVFSRLPVGNFYDTRKDNTGTGDDQVRALAAGIPGIKVFYPAPGDYLDWGPGVRARVLNGCPDAAAAADITTNNCSLVIKLTWEDASILFTGDMEAEKEAEVLDRFGGELKSDVLKVGHHGSAGASTESFLKAVSPRLAFIEVGVNNSYGHPRPPTLARLQAAGAGIYRTDLGGTLAFP